MRIPEQLKGAIRNIASSKNLRSQEVLQMFLFERILERLPVSRYRSNFILKGGLLISSMLGISERTTTDMDTTVSGLPMEKEQITSIVQNILSLDVNDGIQFRFQRIEPIRGDEITPAAICYDYPFLFERKSVPIMAYTLETILAEKYETILRRNIGTTRARDFYDLHTLFCLRRDEVRPEILRQAIQHTAEKRGSTVELKEWVDILSDMKEEPALVSLWYNYIRENTYASDFSFSEVLSTVEQISLLICE